MESTRYNVKVIDQTGNCGRWVEDVNVYATRIDAAGGSVMLYNEDKVIATYPAALTIITENPTY